MEEEGRKHFTEVLRCSTGRIGNNKKENKIQEISDESACSDDGETNNNNLIKKIRHREVRHREIRHREIRHREIRHREIRHREIRHREIRHREIRHREIRHREIRQKREFWSHAW